MDGPYTVDLSVSQTGSVEMRFVRSGLKGDTMIKSAEAELKQLFRNAVAVGESMLSVYQQRGWTDNDTNPIRDAVKQAREILCRDADAPA